MIVLTSGGEKFSKNKFEGGQIDGKKILLKSDGIFIDGEVRLGTAVEKDLQPVVKGDDLLQFLDTLLSNTTCCT